MSNPDLMTVAMVQSELGMAHSTVTNMLADTEPTIVVGRTKLYLRKDVRDVVFERNRVTLDWLGFSLHPDQSYDVLVSADEVQGQE